MNAKKALLLCATHNDLGLIRSLRKLGYYIIASGNRRDLPGLHLVDEYVEGDYSDKELMLSIATEKCVDSVVSCCNDFGVYTAAYVAERMGLPGYDSYETTLLFHNKDRFKRFAQNVGIQTPTSYPFSDVHDALRFVATASYPLIVKPVDLSAGNGIARADSKEEAMLAVAAAFGKSRVGRIVIERFISGSQHGFCTFLRNRKVVAVCSNNEYSFMNPYRVEIDTFPASNFEEVKLFLCGQIEKIAEELSLKDGIFHLQYIMDGDRPMIIEVMRRILGNMYHVPGNMCTALDWEYWQTRVQCGLSLDNFPEPVRQEGCFAYKTILAPRNGRIAKISDMDDECKKYLHSSYWLMGPGDDIVRHESEPVGFHFFMFPDEETMLTLLVDNYRQDFVAME